MVGGNLLALNIKKFCIYVKAIFLMPVHTGIAEERAPHSFAIQCNAIFSTHSFEWAEIALDCTKSSECITFKDALQLDGMVLCDPLQANAPHLWSVFGVVLEIY